jgi:hypothetical protein
VKTLVVDDVDRYYAGIDPRQLHFPFYLELVESLDPGEQKHGQASDAACRNGNVAA